MYFAMEYVNAESCTKFKARYTLVEDAKEAILDAYTWLGPDNWVDMDDSARYDLTDGSYFIVYREA